MEEELQRLGIRRDHTAPRFPGDSGDVFKILDCSSIADTAILRLDFEGSITIKDCIAGLKACGSSGDLERGKQLHLAAREAGIDSNKFVSTALIVMYGKCSSSMREARQIFDGMLHKDVAVWNALIAGYVENGESEDFRGRDHGLQRASLQRRWCQGEN
ncbi:pentatricopeptide repeat-containing protein At5g04780, mitochondrial-like [Selaginella moellendorffii]|uniref:pentatricopeptide repeat-containing protein At5g04780, mitochondrial-like n=1 Tax=Selaginella moellendorffii TaxID=88036 RepID=UPI000D1C9D2E|nr:pentatricopeptide repeat-containing protein At5g04780, mitochondrial-like [Selaginella moellendorffii]|eukprot:XP_024540248.1 pentatricopeptide repeat-containing protein At5g04780, mitochondrial-like [Selaginella moellendorffii]